MQNRLAQYVERLVHSDHRLLRPFRRQLRQRSLWRFNQRSVARGIAIGFFFGILTPVAQIVLAVIAAITLRANVVVAVGGTLITNPITFPVVYFLAYRIGSVVTGRTGYVPSYEAVVNVPDVEVSAEAAGHALDVSGWWPTLVDWISAVGPPLIVGIIVLALCVSLAGYVIANISWLVGAGLGSVVQRARAHRASATTERRSMTKPPPLP